MALSGALVAADGGDTPEIRVAMLCGLVHDLGEMCIGSQHGEADADRDLDFISCQQLVAHPHVGQLLIKQLTNYPRTVARTVAEHQERLDGSGYPHALQGHELSPMGRLLAVTEATLNAIRGDHGQLLHARLKWKPWKTSSFSVFGVCSAPPCCWPASCPPTRPPRQTAFATAWPWAEALRR